MTKVKDKHYVDEEMVTWNTDPIMDQWYEQIRFKNEQAETYTKICIASAPIIEKYAKYFKEVSINWGVITLTLKDDCDIPPLYCECDLAGLSAVYKESKWRNTFNDYNKYGGLIPTDVEGSKRLMEIKLK